MNRDSRGAALPSPAGVKATKLTGFTVARKPAPPLLLCSLLENAIEDCRKATQLIDYRLQYHCPNYELFVSADRLLLKSRIAELLTQAVSSIPESGEVSLVVSAVGKSLVVGACAATSDGIAEIGNLSLLRALSPSWLKAELHLAKHSTLAIVDGETATHQLWEACAGALEFQKHDVNLLHFFDYRSLEKWVKKTSRSVRQATFLISQTIDSDARTGLEVIKKLDIADRSVLISRESEDPQLQEKCERTHLKLIPKCGASLVPVLIGERRNVDAILIDDDPLVRSLWRMSARHEKKSVMTFSKPDEFRSFAAEIGRSVPLYVDSNLGVEIRGEEFSKELRTLGFREIYLATGRTIEDVGPVPWINAVVGKEPPWDIC